MIGQMRVFRVELRKRVDVMIADGLAYTDLHWKTLLNTKGSLICQGAGVEGKVEQESVSPSVRNGAQIWEAETGEQLEKTVFHIFQRNYNAGKLIDSMERYI